VSNAAFNGCRSEEQIANKRKCGEPNQSDWKETAIVVVVIVIVIIVIVVIIFIRVIIGSGVDGGTRAQKRDLDTGQRKFGACLCN
jgi:flagellar biosynthesis/type III secretory pathway M-ring protein FliF/YscJ